MGQSTAGAHIQREVHRPDIGVAAILDHAGPTGRALACIDFSSKEIAVAAAVSGASSMRRVYQTGN